MQGNPTVICIPVGCQSHDDCATEEVCDRLNRVCVKVCETVSCAPTATCTGKDHQAVCDCPPGQRGNPFVRCIEGLSHYDLVSNVKQSHKPIYIFMQKFQL